MLELLKHNSFFILFLYLMGGCANHTPVSPVMNQSIIYSRTLQIGLIDFGVNFNQTILNECAQRFSAITIIPEPNVIELLKQQGILAQHLLQWKTEFSLFSNIQGFHLLFFAFQGTDGNVYIRTVNYLNKSVMTSLKNTALVTCEDLLRNAHMVVVNSHPPFADIKIDHRPVGEAPTWMSLPKGKYKVQCTLPGEVFHARTLAIPDQVSILCERENTQSGDVSSDDDVSFMDEFGSVLVYLLGAAASVAAVVIPLLWLF